MVVSPTARPGEEAHPVILFDGVCNLCNGTVLFVIRRDLKARFRFATLQSATAGSLLQSVTASGEGIPDSVALIESGRLYVRSAAALRIAGRLGFPWRLLAVFLLVPRPLRDWVYDFIARHRYRWFGKREVCMVPTPELRERFLP